MGKFTIKMSAFLLIIFAVAGCSEDSTPTNFGKSFDVKLVESTVADAEGSYFLVTVDGAEEIADVVLPREEGESDATYNSRYEKAISDARSKGVYINVSSSQLNAETVVLNKDNGTLTDASSGVLILVKKDDTVQEYENESVNACQIQILLDAKKAVDSKFVDIQVGNQKLLFKDFQLKKPRIFTDLSGKKIDAVYIPADDNSDINNPKTGTNIILDVADVNVYGYDSSKQEAAGPFKVNYGIQLAQNTISPFVLNDYAQSGEFPGCLSDGSQKCGLNISGYLNLEKEFALSFDNQISESQTVTTYASLVVKGTMPKSYTVTPYRAKYLDNTTIPAQPSVAIFDVETVTENSISSQNISVIGKCGNAGFSLLENPNGDNIGSCQYIVKNIDSKNFRIFINAVDAASAAAADSHLNIKIEDDDNFFTGSDVSVGNISYGEINGGVLDLYKLTVNQPAIIKIKLNSFGQDSKVFSYNNSNNAVNKWTTETSFVPNLNNISTSGGNLGQNSISNYTACTTNSIAVDCYIQVNAASSINKSNSASLTFTYGDINNNSSITLPNTVIKFYTTTAGNE